MLRGFYTAASGMMAQQRRIEMWTNNIANANTPGYKSDQAALRAFPELLLSRLDKATVPTKTPRSFPLQPTIGSINTGVYMQELIPNFRQGDIKETGQPTDIAMINGTLPVDAETGKEGTLFFIVQNENGDIRYTRNGNFTLNPQGFLTTNDGWYVLDENGRRIQLPSTNFAVNADGTIVANNTRIARINIAFAANPNTLVKEGNGLFRSENGVLPSALGNPNITYTLKQGFLERANVDLNRAMTEMLSAYRAFEANQKIVQAYDRSMDKAVNEIGRLK
ncbi:MULTISPECIES: flagellar hook-basal body protein [unclassified Geobacillus]|uniref:flagellar hook-basal body protein n=1 Tax=unclassified Geobacillus TaxID=2642459 RepID=UPI000BE2C7F4|nr:MULTISPECIES: flagellar hook-basal body protein [unclassified Geobacillus]PDM39604.1 flagellar biosynthesis protein FlgC [Parageobacillus yumthangensis]RDV22715.1 flagellar hook-basal body protein [Parageobacillus toebii]TXK91494.1 flagellar hook-basal body protein [Parageobacillus sp. SY1]PUF88191.1 flagellar hook-basal body protein [Geobacillus sp. LYN3]TXK88944.1 flagellar hook-basal body protein [Geobacillus sp. AYS3]